MSGGWIGVDLDGTLAYYDGFLGETIFGKPIPLMVDRIRKWVGEGMEVRIFTARVAEDADGTVAAAIQDWCLKNVGFAMPVTCKKDWGMLCLYDDRCVQVQPNKGILIGGSEYD